MQTYEEIITTHCQRSACVQEDEGGAGEAEVRKRPLPLTDTDLLVCRKMREELGKLRCGMQTNKEIITTHCCRSACVQEDEGGAGKAEVRNADL